MASTFEEFLAFLINHCKLMKFITVMHCFSPEVDHYHCCHINNGKHCSCISAFKISDLVASAKRKCLRESIKYKVDIVIGHDVTYISVFKFNIHEGAILNSNRTQQVEGKVV